MRRETLFGGGALILLGVLFFLQAAQIISDVFGWFWPLLLILLGAMLLTGRLISPRSSNAETFSIDLEGAAKVALDIDHGAGSVNISGGAPDGTALTGIKGALMTVANQRNDEVLNVDIDAGPSFIPFLGPENGAWTLQLTNEVPLSMKFDGGASSLSFDFSDTKLEFLGLEMGASALNLKLPTDAGRTLVDIESGAASINITVPPNVAARIFLNQGASSQNIDTTRFPAQSNRFYTSPDFDSALNKAEINLEGGANSITVR